MNITINNNSEEIPESVKTVKDLLLYKQISDKGTAVAINNTLIKADNRECFYINKGDNIVIISAAFGG